MVGFKYLDFGETKRAFSQGLLLAPSETSGSATVWLDASTASAGGTRIGSMTIEAATNSETWNWIEAPMDAPVAGIHAVYLVFSADGEGTIYSPVQVYFAETPANS